MSILLMQARGMLFVHLSYTIKTLETFKLFFGVKATANLFNLDLTKLNPIY